MRLPLTRQEALAAWNDFLPHVTSYGASRNHVHPGHINVSRLSAALRHRLISEDEIVHDTLRAHDFKSAEKWLQEVCWRRYWKGWLELRPDVWRSWRQRVQELRSTLPESVLKRVEQVAKGESGVACMDAIAHELIATGYLHNHARMWWASFWVHAERLPWELGADFFFRYLLDADPASNTLSWRWVAGLQTPGKTYLVRLSNLERYAADSLLKDRTGSERIADGMVQPFVGQEFADTKRQALPHYLETPKQQGARVGLWLHADDLLPELGPLSGIAPISIAAFSSPLLDRRQYDFSEQCILGIESVLDDGLRRAGQHFKADTLLCKDDDPVMRLLQWARDSKLNEVIAFAPNVGPIHDLLPTFQRQLSAAGIPLTLIRRSSDSHAFGLSGAGFFPYWEKMSRHLQLSSVPF